METIVNYTLMRDPAGNVLRYQNYFSEWDSSQIRREKSFPDLSLHSKVSVRESYLFNEQDFLIRLFGAGAALPDLEHYASELTQRLLINADYVRRYGDKHKTHVYPLAGWDRSCFGYLALTLLLTNNPATTRTVRELVSPRKEKLGYLFDLLLHAYDPAHPVQKKYQPYKYSAAWIDPIVQVLALAPKERSAALARHMQNWLRLMRPYGWKPNLNTAPGHDNLFGDFAFEVALAVCAYDIDDTAFRDHPYYPRDLADYYRQHIRHSRDQWRPLYVGADLPITLPPPPIKADLAKSKRKGIARWVELVADGDIDATEAVLDATGKPRKIHDLQTLLHNLAESDLAIYADLKDDETLEQQASDLSEKRGLGPFEGPPGPPYGPARCEATLAAWSAWLGERGYLLIDIDDKDSDWHAIVVNTVFHPELQQLSEQLGIPVRLHGADLNPNQE